MGAVIAAAVMLAPGIPSIGEIGILEKTAYNAVKHTMRAKSFAVRFLLIVTCGSALIQLWKSYILDDL
jgi:hypothetical protein